MFRKSFDNDPDRRVVIVPKNDSLAAFGSEVLCLPSGELLCCYGRRDFEKGRRDIVLTRSTDRGRTWSEPTIVYGGVDQVRVSRGKSITRLADGTLAMGCGHPDYFRIRWSRDDGHTWSAPFLASDESTLFFNNHIVELPNGDLLATGFRDRKGVDPWAKYIMQFRSTDQGVTWRGPENIAREPNLNLCEPSTVRLHDGRLMCVVRENSYCFYPAFKMFSEDNGQTWSRPVEMPIIAQESYLGQLASGEVLITYRHVGGYAGTFAWLGDPDEAAGYQVCATIRGKTPPELDGHLLRIHTHGAGETALYHLHPAECEESTIRIEAELQCPANRTNACGIHVAQAGWVAFYPDRVELPDCGGTSAAFDTTQLHRYQVVRNAQEMVVLADGWELLRTDKLDRGQIVINRGGHMRFGNVNAFGTVGDFMGHPDAEAEGQANWRSVSLTIDNPNHARHEYDWRAPDGKLPDWYAREHMIELENNYGHSVYFVGQAAWTQLPDGEIYVVTGKSYLRDDEERGSVLRGCYLREEDFTQ